MKSNWTIKHLQLAFHTIHFSLLWMSRPCTQVSHTMKVSRPAERYGSVERFGIHRLNHYSWLHEHVLKLNNLMLNDKHYIQINDAAMGTKMDPSYASIFMRKLERNLIKSEIKFSLITKPTDSNLYLKLQPSLYY